jgi:hypothetical protein
MTLQLLITDFNGLDLSTSSIAQAEPIEDYDEAVSRVITLADGRKFDADGANAAVVRAGMCRAVFRVTGSTADAVNTTLKSITDKDGTVGTLTAISPSTSTDATYTCSARLEAVRPAVTVSRPFKRNYPQVQYVECLWNKISVWVKSA